jgi:hypothetical protein
VSAALNLSSPRDRCAVGDICPRRLRRLIRQLRNLERDQKDIVPAAPLSLRGGSHRIRSDSRDHL